VQRQEPRRKRGGMRRSAKERQGGRNGSGEAMIENGKEATMTGEIGGTATIGETEETTPVGRTASTATTTKTAGDVTGSRTGNPAIGLAPEHPSSGSEQIPHHP